MDLSELTKIVKRDLTFTRIWGASWVSLTGFLWLTAQIFEKFQLPYLPAESWTCIIGALFKLTFSALIATPIIATFNYLATNKKRNILRRRSEIHKRYSPRFSDFKDLDNIVSLGQSMVGNSHIGLDLLRRRHKINPNIVTALYSNPTKDDPSKLIGYFIVYPLSKEAYNEIHNTKIKRGEDIKDKHILKSFKDAKALYISMIGGDGMHAAGYVIEEMTEQLAPLLHSGNLLALFARGATEDGNRILRKWGFQKLADPSEISCLPITKDLLKRKEIRHKLSYR